MDYKKRYRLWCEKATDKEVLNQLSEMSGDDEKIKDSFYKDLEFGTAGQRGILGAGTNCLNIYTVSKTTQGLADFLNSSLRKKNKSALISFDSRINSGLFAKTAAKVLASNGIKVFLTYELQPTPFVSFGVREMKCDAGIMVTASHNPAEFNGYKVYGADGCQINDFAAEKILAEIEKVDPFAISTEDFDFYLNTGKIEYVPEEVYGAFMKRVFSQHLSSAEGIRVVYSPLNGAGWKMVPEMLENAGVADLILVAEQFNPDGNFPTCPYPNPEKREALKLGLEYAAKVNADIFIATDPDCDRTGIAVKHKGEYVVFSGNEMGLLLMDYVLEMKSKKGLLPANPLVVKTIVTTNLASRIAEDYQARMVNVLTGFKFIGEVVNGLESEGNAGDFILGFEESCGYLVGSHARDKDAVVASMLFAECCAYRKKQGKTLVDRLNELYTKYGRYSHSLLSKKFAGASGSEKMKEMLAKLRAADVSAIGGKNVLEKIDLLKENALKLPKSNVVIFNLQDNAQLIIRPSGTEPLIKFYLTAAETDEKNKQTFGLMESFIDGIFAD